MNARTRWLGLAAVAVAVPLVLVGCSNDGSDSSSGSSGGAGAADAAAVVPEPAGAGRSAGSAAEAPATASLKLEPALVRTAKIDVVVDDVAAKAGEAIGYARAADGLVAGDDRSGTGTDSRATLVLRVPPAGMDTLLDQLGRLGTERERTSSTQDVTADVADVEARVATMKASIARVRAILSRADKIGDVVAVEGELSRRTTELEALEARQRALAGQTGYATVTVGLYARSAATTPPPADRGGFLGGLADGWHALTTAVGWLLAGLGAVLPFLLLVVPLALLARWAQRRFRPAPRRAPAPEG